MFGGSSQHKAETEPCSKGWNNDKGVAWDEGVAWKEEVGVAWNNDKCVAWNEGVALDEGVAWKEGVASAPFCHSSGSVHTGTRQRPCLVGSEVTLPLPHVWLPPRCSCDVIKTSHWLSTEVAIRDGRTPTCRCSDGLVNGDDVMLR